MLLSKETIGVLRISTSLLIKKCREKFQKKLIFDKEARRNSAGLLKTCC